MEAKGIDSPGSWMIQDLLLGPSGVGVPGAVRYMVLEIGSVDVDPTGRVDRFQEGALALPSANNPINFNEEIVASIVPGGGMPILGTENAVDIRWEDERESLSIGLKGKEEQNPILPKGTILTMYCEPGSQATRTLAAVQTLVLAKWVLVDQPRMEVAVARGPGGPASWQNTAASINLLSNIISVYSGRFFRVGPLPHDVAIGEEPLFSVKVGRRTGATLVDSLAGRLRVNHLLAWNFAHLVSKYRGAFLRPALVEGTFPFFLIPEFCPSRPVFPPLILELRSNHTLETYHDRWMFPETDPSRCITPILDSKSHRFGIRFESGLDTIGMRNDDWTIEYLVRQDWGDARLTVGDRSAPPRTGENLSFRISAVQSRDTSVAPLSLLRHPTLPSISSRALLAQAFAAECPSEIVSKLAKDVEASEIRSELRKAESGRWLPTGVIKCEVLADAEELGELQLLADRLSWLLSDRCTLGCQVVVECVAVDSNLAKAR